MLLQATDDTHTHSFIHKSVLNTRSESDCVDGTRTFPASIETARSVVTRSFLDFDRSTAVDSPLALRIGELAEYRRYAGRTAGAETVESSVSPSTSARSRRACSSRSFRASHSSSVGGPFSCGESGWYFERSNPIVRRYSLTSTAPTPQRIACWLSFDGNLANALET